MTLQEKVVVGAMFTGLALMFVGFIACPLALWLKCIGFGALACFVAGVIIHENF